MRRTGTNVEGRIESRGVGLIYPVGGEPGARARSAYNDPQGSCKNKVSKGLNASYWPRRMNPTSPRDSILPSTEAPVLLDQRLAIDPHLPSQTHLAVFWVTSLEPRTLHQPEKLQNVSKNDYGFNTFIFYVNEKRASVTSFASIKCSSCTAG